MTFAAHARIYTMINAKNTTVKELTPNDSHKSFYGKARVYTTTDGASILMSYTTPVAMITRYGELVRLWDGWTATTGRHIAAFCGCNKRAYLALREYGEEDMVREFTDDALARIDVKAIGEKAASIVA